jgi:lysozyme family protein
MTPKDMDFIEAKNSAAREIALAIGVPPMLLGIPGDNTFSDDPYDPGGPTNRGVTLTEFARWRGITLTALTRSSLVAALKSIGGDEVRDIYRAKYWQPAACALLPEAVAVMHFDAAVNHGVGGAARLLQAALGVSTDGEIGPDTINAARTQPARTVIERYAELRRARYRALPHFWRFGRGWLRRVDATEVLASSLAGETLTTTETAKGTTTMADDFKFPLPGDVPGQDVNAPGGKWWPQSKTVWGALITAVTTVLPVVGPLIGINISADMIKMLGDQSVVVVQALGGLVGTLLTLYGRANATGPLVRQNISLKM